MSADKLDANTRHYLSAVGVQRGAATLLRSDRGRVYVKKYVEIMQPRFLISSLVYDKIDFQDSTSVLKFGQFLREQG